jgi:hypothetical protein
MVACQRLLVDAIHAGAIVTVAIEDTIVRVLHNDIELAVRPRTNER